MSRFVKKSLVILLTSIVSVLNRQNAMSKRHQKYTTQPTLINLHPNEYSQELLYYLLAFNLDRCVRSCNTLHDLSSIRYN